MDIFTKRARERGHRIVTLGAQVHALCF